MREARGARFVCVETHVFDNQWQCLGPLINPDRLYLLLAWLDTDRLPQLQAPSMLAKCITQPALKEELPG